MNQLIAVPKIQINFPQDGKIRSRKVVKRSNARNTGKYPSWKMQRMMRPPMLLFLTNNLAKSFMNLMGLSTDIIQTSL
jgi:pantoate kinase